MYFNNRIQKYKHTLTKTDQKIIDFLLHQQSNLISKTISNLSKDIGTSPATITRFCQKIGYDSFQEMKLSYIKEMEDQQNNDHKVFNHIYRYYQNIIESTQQFIDEEQINRIISKIINANQILYCGIGNSGLIAEELNRRTERMGINSRVETDAHGMVIKTSLLDKEDMLLCFSASGETNSVIDAAKIAEVNNIDTVSVTNHERTTLSKYSNEIILTSNYRMMPDAKFVNTQLPSLFLLDILTYKLLNIELYKNNYHTTLEAVVKYNL